MTPSLPLPTPAAFDLPVGRCSTWIREARALWLAHPFFLLTLAALAVISRWVLDLVITDSFIVLSYLTDAWIFAWLALGVSRAREGNVRTIARAGWQGLQGRFFAVLKTALWGIPAVATSYLIFLLVPEGVQALVVIQGNVLLATAVLLIALLLGGFVSMMLALLPVLAAIQMARDKHATLMSSGLWAYRGVRAGVRPLSALFLVFLCGTLVCHVTATWVTGHLPLDWFEGWSADDILSTLMQAPLTVFIAMNAFLAVLPSVATDLLRSADTDLSDEIFSDAEKKTYGDAFGVRVLEVAARGLRLISALSVVFLVIYAAFSGEDEAAKWMICAVVSYIWGGSFRKSALAWREGQSWSLRYRFLITPVVLSVVLVALVAVAIDQGLITSDDEEQSESAPKESP